MRTLLAVILVGMGGVAQAACRYPKVFLHANHRSNPAPVGVGNGRGDKSLFFR